MVTAWNDLTLCIDNMFVQGQVFLTAIDLTIKYQSATHLHNQSINTGTLRRIGSNIAGLQQGWLSNWKHPSRLGISTIIGESM